MKRSYWKPEKNEWLIKNRNISFEEVEDAIYAGRVVGWLKYKGTKKTHAGQIRYLVDIGGEIWVVVISITHLGIFLRTTYPYEE